MDKGSTAVPVPADLVRAIESGREEVTVRALLRWFGSERRLPATVSEIREVLDKLGVSTDPDFEFAYLDAPIRFIGRANGLAKVEPIAVDAESTAPVVTEPWSDPTYRVGKLPAANRRPLSLKPDASLSEAITLMLQYDYSQIPVMTGDREVKGAVTWQSIGSKIGLGQCAEKLAEVMEPAPESKSDDSLFETLATIERFGYVLVRADDKKVVGIVTATDVTVQFRVLTEPFILIGEIENYVRRILDGRFTISELQKSVDPKRKSTSISRVSDLAFGEYIRLLEDPANWKRLEINLDRTLFVKTLDEIRRIRNDVMHFDPDGIGDTDLESLRRFVGLFQKLATLGVIRRGSADAG